MTAWRRAAWLWLSAAVVAADQFTKLLIERGTPEGWVHTVLPGFFNLVHRHNRGVAFGLLSGVDSPWLPVALIAFAVAAVGVISWMLAGGHAGGWRGRAGLALLAGGAAGNVADRLAHGSVIDFIELHWRQFYWPAFNVADSAIVVGAGLVMLELLFDRSGEKSAEKAAGDSGGDETTAS